VSDYIPNLDRIAILCALRRLESFTFWRFSYHSALDIHLPILEGHPRPLMLLFDAIPILRSLLF
jgi:hypothetical protein